jgi:hypothetical protein
VVDTRRRKRRIKGRRMVMKRRRIKRRMMLMMKSNPNAHSQRMLSPLTAPFRHPSQTPPSLSFVSHL